jgi:hypothetical protein
VNKTLEYFNSALVRKYCLLDKRFRDLAIVLKTWSKEQGDNFNRLNSFSIYMLLLAYMIEEKYILNLQQIPGLERQEIEYEI